MIDLRPAPAAHVKTRNQQLWNEDPDACCRVNKLEPLQNIKSRYKVWMSGLIGFQNRYRNTLQIMDDDQDLLKFYPLIDFDSALVDEYLENHGLPQHPLKKYGYSSVGCTHCTAPGAGREGRWNDHSKTECGLHRP